MAAARCTVRLAHRFSDDLTTGVENARDDRRIHRRDVSLEDRRAVHERNFGDEDVVLDRDRPPVEPAGRGVLDLCSHIPGAEWVLSLGRRRAAATGVLHLWEVVGELVDGREPGDEACEPALMPGKITVAHVEAVVLGDRSNVVQRRIAHRVSPSGREAADAQCRGSPYPPQHSTWQGDVPEKGRRPPRIRDGRRQVSARNKPSSVPSRGRIIHLGSPSPATSCGLPGIQTGRATPHPLFGLAPGGVYRATPVTRSPVRSYRTLSPLPVPQAAIGGLLSVALSVALRRPGVTRHPALWSSDFPPAA